MKVTKGIRLLSLVGIGKSSTVE